MSEGSARPGATDATAPPPDVRLLLPALLAWVIVALCLGRGPVVPAAAAVVLIVAGALVARRRRRHDAGSHAGRSAAQVLALLLGGALLLLTAGEEIRADRGGVAELARDRVTVRASGRVMAEPRRVRQIEAGPPRVLVTLRLDRVEARGRTIPAAAPVLVLGDERWLDAGWRRRVTVTGRLAPADAGDRVEAVLTARGGPDIVAGPGVLVEVADRTREAMRQVVAPLPDDARGLVPAMIIGDKEAVPDDLEDAMRATGMTHLTAVSGTNCSLVVAAAMWSAGLVGVRRRARAPLGALVLLAFVVLARPDPSVIRAAVMGAVGLVGLLRHRRAIGMPALAGAILVLLAVDPWLARSYGFALSVLATLGLLVFARPWAAALRRVVRVGPLAEALTIPLAAQVMCAPVIVLLQGEVSVVGVLANAAAAPFIAPVTVLGAVVAVLAVPWPWAAGIVAWVAAVPAWCVAVIARVAEDAPMRALPWRDDALGALLLAAVLLAVVLTGAAARRWARRHTVVTLLVLLVIAVVALPVSYTRTRTGFPGPRPALVMCDVGQGDAFVAASGPGRAVIVDTGPDPDLLDRCLDALGIETVDAVVLTHFDTDHVGGLGGVDRGRAVGDVVVSGPSMAQVPGPVARWWRDHGSTVHVAGQGDAFVWGNVSAVVRGPRRTAVGLSPNAGSLVLDLVVGGDEPLRALMLADADREAEAAVRADLRRTPDAPGPVAATDLPFDVVKVAHHGSANHDPALLASVAAPVAFISAGADNRYGHPAPSLLRSVAAAGSVPYRTDEDGAVAIRKESGELLVVRERRSRPLMPGGTGGG